MKVAFLREPFINKINCMRPWGFSNNIFLKDEIVLWGRNYVLKLDNFETHSVYNYLHAIHFKLRRNKF